VRDGAGHAVHSAVSRHRARLRIFTVARNHLVDVRGHCRWDERAVFAPERSTSLAAIAAKTRAVDAACEAVHGLSAAGYPAVSSLRARRPARSGRGDLGELFSVSD